LGRRSFSLYLVHEPIVVSVALLLGGRAPAPVTLAIALPFALAAAALFFRVVESPSHRFARAVSRRLAVRGHDAPAHP
jgi:peptidoglycan/LPS O-acetylase OafA/YrhL